MIIILGATGHIGSAVATRLLQQGEPVTVVTRDEAKALSLKEQGAEVAVADVGDTERLARILAHGKRLFLLNPPADPSTDTVREESRTVESILSALKGSAIDFLVAESTYGAQPGDGLGDLGVLYELEQALAAQPISHVILRGAYYMSNWDASLATARERGVVQSMYPADFCLPMVAPDDIADVAARLLARPSLERPLVHVEGPRPFSIQDVADALSAELERDVQVEVTPRDQWEGSLRSAGFSEPAARSMVAMTAVTLSSGAEQPADPIRGKTTLRDYFSLKVSATVGG